MNEVTPFMGVWIEIGELCRRWKEVRTSHTLYGCINSHFITNFISTFHAK